MFFNSSLVLLVSTLLMLTVPWAGKAQQQTSFTLSKPDVSSSHKLRLWATHYNLYLATMVSPGGLSFKDREGKAISDPVSAKDWCLGAIEGTIRVSYQGSFETINFAGRTKFQQVDCAQVLSIDPRVKPWIHDTSKSFFAPAKGIWGDGVNGYKLVPFRSIAVDKRYIPYGSVVFIPAMRGAKMALPTGGDIVHDGFFFAADTGKAIIGNHVDIYCGEVSTNCMPSVIKSNCKELFDAFLVDDSDIAEQLDRLHR
jgi:3D (Asp-Asp-Asp) domain-containing protein